MACRSRSALLGGMTPLRGAEWNKEAIAMLEELGRDLKQVALAGVGAAAILAEKGCELARECAKKGAVTVEQGRAVTQELRTKAEQAAGERRARAQEERLARMTREERDALRRKLDDLDALEEEAVQAASESGCAPGCTQEDSTDGHTQQ